MMNDRENGFFSGMTKPKKYAVALGVSAVVLASLALGINNMTGGREIDTTRPISTTAAEADANKNDVPDQRYSHTMIVPATELTTLTEAATAVIEDATEAQRAAPTSYSLPLGTDIGKDYSRGVPVYNDVMADWRTHDGVDFNGAVGDQVKAIADGIVRESYADDLWGGVVVLDHGGGVYATYCGLNTDNMVKRGEIVSKSQTIGELGSLPIESDADFPHLHLEIRVDGEAADPLEVMGYYE